MPWDERNSVWPALKSEIARIFDDVIDQLHIFHIQELYARGLDKTAEEVSSDP